jgi:hypothetical protein
MEKQTIYLIIIYLLKKKKKKVKGLLEIESSDVFTCPMN